MYDPPKFQQDINPVGKSSHTNPGLEDCLKHILKWNTSNYEGIHKQAILLLLLLLLKKCHHAEEMHTSAEMQHWDQDAQGWDPFSLKHQRNIKERQTHTHTLTERE